MCHELKVFKKSGMEVVDSRDVAEMVDRPHNDLMKTIRGYCDHLNAGDFSLVDFFVQSTYTDNKGESRPCYLLTKKGCDMVANKMTGEKGVLFTAAYVTAFEKMREHISGESKLSDARQAVAEAKLNNSRARLSSMWLKIADTVPIPEYKQICASYACSALAGREVLPLPSIEEHFYTAEEVGEILGGVSRNMVGRVANQNGIKTPEYGKEVWDKSPYSAKQVSSWRYNQRAVERLRELIN